MKRYIFTIAMLTATMVASAQDTYESARLLGNDLNGTAKYVGMGGAMEALGADISLTGTNPAGIGLYRHSMASASLGFVNQEGASTFDGLSKTNVSIDQLGFVYTMETGSSSFFNFAFNYHKSRNFDHILRAEGALRDASLNAITCEKDGLSSVDNGGFFLDNNDAGNLIGWESTTSDYRANTYSQIDYVNANTMLEYDSNGDPWYTSASGYNFARANRGWIGDFDFTLSGNINNRLYLGFTLGFQNVNYKGYSEYMEQLVDANDVPEEVVTYGEEHKISGNGVNVKIGAIFRPIEESPFRIGAYIHTPTWYQLETHNRLYASGSVGSVPYYGSTGDDFETYKFKFYTPWKFGLSLGHTIEDFLALGLTYEYSDNSSADNRYYDGTFDSNDNENTESDRAMNRHTEKTLKATSTLKAGLEFRPDPTLAVRFGYNYVSPMYDTKGVRSTHINSFGVMYATSAEYVNWKDTHRITCGVGYRADNWNIDIAYQYSTTNGDFYPFQSSLTYVDPTTNKIVTDNKYCKPTEVNFKRHQVLLTLGYTF